jgi:hypothetical protein
MSSCNADRRRGIAAALYALIEAGLGRLFPAWEGVLG